MGRILGIDYGEKRVGLALSDEEQKFSFEFETWQNDVFFERLPALIKEKNIELIVLGHPLNMNSEKTQKTLEVEQFKKKIEESTNMPVELMDERLSSQMATGISGRQKDIDALAAQILLENYLNKKEKQNF